MAIFLPSCTVYTEKRSEALSQSVTATKSSIDAGRFDLAQKYSEQSVRLAFPPKKAIKINPIVTKKAEKVEVIVKEGVKLQDKASTINLSTPAPTLEQQGDILRIVVPEKFKNATLLVENSTEWNNLLKEKEFAKQLLIDNVNLNKNKDITDKELLKQDQMNSKMVKDLNLMQTKLVKKDLVILKLWIALGSLAGIFAACIYLRVKGVL